MLVMRVTCRDVNVDGYNDTNADVSTADDVDDDDDDRLQLRKLDKPAAATCK